MSGEAIRTTVRINPALTVAANLEIMERVFDNLRTTDLLSAISADVPFSDMAYREILKRSFIGTYFINTTSTTSNSDTASEEEHEFPYSRCSGGAGQLRERYIDMVNSVDENCKLAILFCTTRCLLEDFRHFETPHDMPTFAIRSFEAAKSSFRATVNNMPATCSVLQIHIDNLIVTADIGVRPRLLTSTPLPNGDGPRAKALEKQSDVLSTLLVTHRKGVNFVAFSLQHDAKSGDENFWLGGLTTVTSSPCDISEVKGAVFFVRSYTNAVYLTIQQSLKTIPCVAGCTVSNFASSTPNSTHRSDDPCVGFYICGDNVEVHNVTIESEHDLERKLAVFRDTMAETASRKFAKRSSRFGLFFNAYAYCVTMTAQIQRQLDDVHKTFPDMPVYGCQNYKVYSKTRVETSVRCVDGERQLGGPVAASVLTVITIYE